VPSMLGELRRERETFFRLGHRKRHRTAGRRHGLCAKTFQLRGARASSTKLATKPPTQKSGAVLPASRVTSGTDPFNPLQFAERSNEFNPYEVTFYPGIELPSAEPRCGTSSALKSCRTSAT